MVIDNLLGFLPAPYIYGLIFEKTPSDPKLAMSLVFYYVCFGTVLIFAGTMLRYKEFREKEIREQEIQVEFLKKKQENKIVVEIENIKIEDNASLAVEIPKNEVKNDIQVNVNYFVKV